MVKAKLSSIHQKYTFWVKVSSDGGSAGFLGPYYLDVGCTPTSVTFTNNPAFVTNVNKLVADPVTQAYTMMQPTASRSYCVIEDNKIVNPDGTQWSGSNQVAERNGCTGNPPCTVFDLVATTYPGVIPFKILTQFSGITHLSPLSQFTITCGSSYVIREREAPVNP